MFAENARIRIRQSRETIKIKLFGEFELMSVFILAMIMRAEIHSERVIRSEDIKS